MHEKEKKSYAEAVMYDNILTCANTTGSSKIYCELLACEKRSPLTRERALPIYAKTWLFNSLNSQICQNDANIFSSQDEELFSIL